MQRADDLMVEADSFMLAWKIVPILVKTGTRVPSTTSEPEMFLRASSPEVFSSDSWNSASSTRRVVLEIVNWEISKISARSWRWGCAWSKEGWFSGIGRGIFFTVWQLVGSRCGYSSGLWGVWQIVRYWARLDDEGNSSSDLAWEYYWRFILKVAAWWGVV